MSLKNKIAFITGAATGIGKVTALTLAKKGAKVIVADINEEEGNKTVNEIVEAGGNARFVHLDVCKFEEINGIIKQVFQEEGSIDLAVNSAGIGGAIGPIHEAKLEDWNQTISINLTGLFLCLQAEIQCMLMKGIQGRIVNVASLAGLNGIPGGSAYSVSKHGVVSLTKTAAGEYGEIGLRVNAVCPGLIETAMIKHLPEKVMAYNDMRVPMKRIGQAQEVADAIVWLLSEESSYVNGHCLLIDGGFNAN